MPDLRSMSSKRFRQRIGAVVEHRPKRIVPEPSMLAATITTRPTPHPHDRPLGTGRLTIRDGKIERA